MAPAEPVKVQLYRAQPVVGTAWVASVGASAQLVSAPLFQPTARLVVKAVPAVCLM